jgi:hypothetical protein
MYTAKIVLGS